MQNTSRPFARFSLFLRRNEWKISLKTSTNWPWLDNSSTGCPVNLIKVEVNSRMMYELREWCKIIGVNLFTYRLLCLERGLHCGERKQRLVLHILRNYRSKQSQESKQQIRKIYVSSDLQLPNMAEFDLVSRPEDEKIHLSPRSHRCTAVSLFWQRTPEKHNAAFGRMTKKMSWIWPWKGFFPFDDHVLS